MAQPIEIEVSFMRRLAESAAAQTLPRFRANGAVTNKLEGGFDPVTEADREAERAIRELIRAEFPDHGVVGEEFGAENADSRHVWVIDPIDGTRAFISGLPLWGTLVGLLEDGRAVAGMMSQPFTGELFHASGGRGVQEGPAGKMPLRARPTRRIEDAILCTTSPSLFKDIKREAYDRVEMAARLCRYGTDCYAYAMLSAGQVDLVVEAGLQSYDIVALVPLIEAAGGVVTTWDGERPEGGGDILAAATPELHEAALDLLNR
jgi:histidinol phosphatase-like enzyme (inositol monophosphatase family)